MRTSRTALGRAMRPAWAARDRPLASTGRRLVAAAALLAFGAIPVAALDATARTPVPSGSYRSAREALRMGVRDYNAGDKEGAARALEYAADQGHALALWKLGRMYAEGDGVPHDDLKAFEFFSRIADDTTDEGPEAQNSGVVASAFTALGAYFLDGIKGHLRAREPRARLRHVQLRGLVFRGSERAVQSGPSLSRRHRGRYRPASGRALVQPRGREGPCPGPGAARPAPRQRGRACRPSGRAA